METKSPHGTQTHEKVQKKQNKTGEPKIKKNFIRG